VKAGVLSGLLTTMIFKWFPLTVDVGLI